MTTLIVTIGIITFFLILAYLSFREGRRLRRILNQSETGTGPYIFLRLSEHEQSSQLPPLVRVFVKCFSLLNFIVAGSMLLFAIVIATSIVIHSISN